MDSASVAMKDERRFVKSLVLLFWGAPLLIAAVNYVTNPLGYFNGLPLAKTMNTAPQIYSSLRYHKAYDVWRHGTEYLVLGSSRVGFGLGNLHGFFSGSAYNNAVPGMQLYEIARSIEHAHTIKPLRSTLIGLDFFAFNKHTAKYANGFKPSRMLTVDMKDDAQRMLWRSLISDVMEGLLSIDVFNATKERLFTGEPNTQPGIILGEDGGWGGNKAAKRPVTAAKQLAHYKRVEGMYIKDVWFAGGEKFELYGYDSRLDIYRDMLRFAHEQGIQMRMFVTPVHARLLVELDELGLWPCYEQWKRELWEINREIATEFGTAPFDLWDFAGVDDWSTENIERDEMLDWFVDSSHFTQRLGKIMLEQMLQEKDHGFGQKITNHNVMERRLEEVKQGLLSYRADKQMLGEIKKHILDVRKDMPQPVIGSCTGTIH